MNTLPVLCCGPATPALDEGEADMLAAQFKALADPARGTILNRLAAADEVCVCDFVAALGLAQPTVSHHLKVLRDAGLVESSRRGTWAFYRLLPPEGAGERAERAQFRRPLDAFAEQETREQPRHRRIERRQDRDDAEQTVTRR